MEEVHIVAVQVAAQDGHVDCGIAFIQHGLGAIEPAVDGHAFLELEGGGAVCSSGGFVRSACDPNFLAADRFCQRGLQWTGALPTGAIARLVGGDIQNPCRMCWADSQCGAHQGEKYEDAKETRCEGLHGRGFLPGRLTCVWKLTYSGCGAAHSNLQVWDGCLMLSGMVMDSVLCRLLPFSIRGVNLASIQ